MATLSRPDTVLTVDADRSAALGAIATSTGRSPADVLNEAPDAYLELTPEDWAAIEEGERDAAAGQFATDEEVTAVFAIR